MLIEEWRPIPSFPGYEASSFGGIRSKHGYLKPWINDTGYRVVAPYQNGRRTSKTVHHLVCEAFHGPKPAWAAEAAHNNGRKLSNRPDNLRWSTKLDNARDKRKHGTGYGGERHHRSTFTLSQIKTIRIQYDADPRPETIKRLAEAFIVKTNTIRRIVKGERWAASFKKEKAA